jgi:predicted GH43/DUF377 family glycosyl hydrolase
MVTRIDSKVLVRTEDFTPTDSRFNVIGVFNPGAARCGDEIILMVRIAQAYPQDKPGWLHSPRSRQVDGKANYEIDTMEISPDDDGDHRKPLLVNGHRRLAFISHLEMVVLDASGWNVKEIRRVDDLFGCTNYEIYGVEDPRITKIGDVYYITYVGVSEEMGVATCLMTTTDFKSFERHGVIFSCENKDVVLYPEKMNGNFYCHHRPVGRINIRKVSINSAVSPDALCWGKHVNTLHCSESGWYGGRIGAGTPPVRTDVGWLSIFHGVEYANSTDKTGRYTGGALLTALDDPSKAIGVSKEPFFVPETDFEKGGYVNNVVFPTGMVRDQNDPDKLNVFYGCADSCVAVTAFSQKAILESIGF